METSLKSRMQYQPDALKQLLFGLHNENAKQRPIADKWSIAENIAHLGRYNEVFKERMETILKKDHPHFTRYVADVDEGFAEWCKYDQATLIRRFHESRKTLNDFLVSLDKEQLKRNGHHPVFGLMSISGWTEFFLLHEAHHFFTILKLAPQISGTD